MSKHLFLAGLIAILVLTSISPAFAHNLKWVHTWGGEGNQRAYGVSLDSSWNVYLAGYHSGDAILVKFNKFGEPLWSLSWSYRSEEFHDLVTDSTGNLYTAGYTISTGKHLAIIAVFNQDGDLLWDMAFGDAGWDWDYDVKAIAIDSESNVYVTGNMRNRDTGDYNGFIAKLTQDSIYWIKYWDTFQLDYGEDLAIYEHDSSKSLYLLGRYDGGVFLAKINPDSGEIAWTRSLGGSEGSPRLSIDSQGHPWAFMGTYSEMELLRINPENGEVENAAKIRYTTYDYVYHRDIYVDEHDNICLAADVRRQGATENDAVVSKLKIIGDGVEILWSHLLAGSDDDYSTSCISRGMHTYLVGYTESTTGSNKFIEAQVTSFSKASSGISMTLQSISVSIEDPSANVEFISRPLDNVIDEDAFILRVSESPSMHGLVTGMNNKVYRNEYYLGSGWERWMKIPPGSTQEAVTAARYGPLLYLAVKGMNNKIYYGKVHEGTGEFSGWFEVSGRTPSKPTITIDDDCQILWIVVRGMNDRIYIRGLNLTTEEWTGWIKLPGKTSEAPAAAAEQCELHIAVKGFSDNSIWHGYYTYSSKPWRFSGWTRVPGATPSAPDLSITSEGYIYHLHLAVRGADDKIYVNEFTRTTGWLGWEKIPTGWTRLSPAIKVVDDKIYVMVTGGDNGLWMIIKDPIAGWGSWQKIPGRSPREPDLA